MRTFILILSMGLLAGPLAATEQLIEVTPANLDGWALSGGDKSLLSSKTTLTLSADTQLSREFAEGAVILHAITQPVFSEDAAEWPIVDVGPMALALVRNGKEGRLVLVIDESKVVDLPWSVPLDDKKTPIELVCAYDPATGTGLVSLQSTAKLFDVPRSAKPTEVWLSAGRKSPWPFDLLQVVLLTPEVEEPGKSSAGLSSEEASGKHNPGKQLTEIMARLLADGKTGAAAGAVVGQADKTVEAAASTLEVFTPPSVRRVRVIEAIRKTVASSQRK